MISASVFPKSVEAATPFTGSAGIGGPDAGEELHSGIDEMHDAFDVAADDGLLKAFWAGRMSGDQAYRFLMLHPQLMALLKYAPNWRRIIPTHNAPQRIH